MEYTTIFYSCITFLILGFIYDNRVKTVVYNAVKNVELRSEKIAKIAAAEAAMLAADDAAAETLELLNSRINQVLEDTNRKYTRGQQQVDYALQELRQSVTESQGILTKNRQTQESIKKIVDEAPAIKETTTNLTILKQNLRGWIIELISDTFNVKKKWDNSGCRGFPN
jgi:hypothetical protein